MFSAALREGDNTQSVLPASKVRVAGEERFELSFCGASQPSEIRLVKAFVRTRHIAASAFMSGMLVHHVLDQSLPRHDRPGARRAVEPHVLVIRNGGWLSVQCQAGWTGGRVLG
jgi:hypothetical protein